MSYQEKRIVASVVTGLFILGGYCLYSMTQYQAKGATLLHNLKFWSTAMLVTIGLGIILMMLIQLVLHIFLAISNEVKKEIAKKSPCGTPSMSCEELEFSDGEDEMDKLISLQASQYSFAVVGFGFVAALGTLYFQLPPAIMLNVLFLSNLLATLLEGCLRIRYYRTGIRHG